MPLAEETAMSESETDAFLGKMETGVLSLAQEDEPYAIPVSYGYDADNRTFYLRLVSTPESEKRAFLESSPRARLVVYDEEGDGETEAYRSVVAAGALERIDPSDLSIEQIEQYGRAKRPLFEIWGSSKRNLDIQLFALEPSEMSGRRAEIDRDADE